MPPTTEVIRFLQTKTTSSISLYIYKEPGKNLVPGGFQKQCH